MIYAEPFEATTARLGHGLKRPIGRRHVVAGEGTEDARTADGDDPRGIGGFDRGSSETQTAVHASGARSVLFNVPILNTNVEYKYTEQEAGP